MSVNQLKESILFNFEQKGGEKRKKFKSSKEYLWGLVFIILLPVD